jgi:hypothetical protein
VSSDSGGGCGLCEARHRRLVRHDDDEVHDRGQHYEGDQGREQLPDVDPSRRVVREVRRAADLADDVHDDLHRGRDNCAERRCHHEGNGQLDQVAAHDEVLEVLDHVGISFCCRE